MLKGRLQQLEALKAENMRLRDLLGSSLKISDRMLIAELMAVDLDPYRQGDAGRPLFATVLLITDANHGLPVQINRNGLRTPGVAPFTTGPQSRGAVGLDPGVG